MDRASVIRGAVNRIQDLLPSPFTPLGYEQCSTIVEHAVDSLRKDERDIELRVMGRISQSGFGPGSDVCEKVWAVLEKYDIHGDGKTAIYEYVEQLALLARGEQ